MGAATLWATTSALAPGYVQRTHTCGGVTGGYCVSGRRVYAIPPQSVVTTESTVAKIGRSMKNRENMLAYRFHKVPSPLWERVRVRAVRVSSPLPFGRGLG